MSEWKRETETSFIHELTPQMSSTAKARPQQSQKAEIQSGSPTWVIGARVLLYSRVHRRKKLKFKAWTQTQAFWYETVCIPTGELTDAPNLYIFQSLPTFQDSHYPDSNLTILL